LPQLEGSTVQVIDQLIEKKTRRNDLGTVDITSGGSGEFGGAADIEGLYLQFHWHVL
jgi:hypothetical protein